MRRLLALLFSLCFLWPSLAQATVDWDDSFEYANQTALFSTWSASCGVGFGYMIQTTAVNGVTPHSGSKMLLEHMDDGVSTCFIDRFLTALSPTLYTRYWIYVQNFTWAGGVPTKSTFQGQNGKYPSFWWGLFGTDGTQSSANMKVTEQAVSLSPGTFTTVNTPSSGGGVIPQNQWTCVEFQLTMSSPGGADGIVRQWVNGVQTVNITNERMRPAAQILVDAGPPATYTWPDAQFEFVRLYNQHGFGNIYYDQYAVSRDARINDCPGAVVDTTPPSQVTGFSVGSPSSSSLLITATNGTDNIDSGLNLRIERCTVISTNPCSTFALVHTQSATGGAVSTYPDSGIAASTTFCYRANNSDQSGNLGPYSSTACGTTGASAPSPTRHTLGTDTFNRANENPLSGGGAWVGGYTGLQNCQIVGNAVEATTIGTSCAETRTDVLPNDQWIQGTLGAFTGSSFSGALLIVRATSPATLSSLSCAAERNGGPTSEIFFDGASLASSSTETWAAGDVMLCEYQGTTVRFSRNGVLILSANSSARASGRVGLFNVALGALTDSTIDSVSWGDYTAAPLPVMASAVCNTTGCDLTAGATTPSFLRVQTTGTGGTNIVYTWNDGVVMTAGRYTHPGGGWAAGLTNVTFFAQDGNHQESSLPGDHITVSLAGLTMSADVTPPVLSLCAPSGTISTTQTTQTISCRSDELADLHFSITTDTTYAAMTGTTTPTSGIIGMTTVDGLNHSAQVTVSNGNSYTFKVRGQDRSPNLNQNTSSVTINFTVSNADTTAPTAATNLVCTAISSSQAPCTFTPGTDAVGVTGNQAKIGTSTGGVCTPTTIINPLWGTSSPQQLINLNGGITYCLKMNPFDAAGNLAPDSNISTFTTPVLGDPIPPSTVVGCVVGTVAYDSVTLSCTPATDNVGVQNYDWYRCQVGVDCPNYVVKFTTNPSTLTDQQAITPLTHYHYIVFSRDFQGNPAAAPSATIDVTTPDVPAGIIRGLCPCKKR